MSRDLPATEAERVWQRFRIKMGDPAKTTRDGRRRAAAQMSGSKPFTKGRDPRGIGDVLKTTTETFGWTREIARGEVVSGWTDLVGERAAAFTVAEEVVDDILIVRCSSTAWAQQMRMMHGDILTKLMQRFPESKVRRIRFDGPAAPRIGWGKRRVPGRGPRDTYG